jgi:hypothetical protein
MYELRKVDLNENGLRMFFSQPEIDIMRAMWAGATRYNQIVAMATHARGKARGTYLKVLSDMIKKQLVLFYPVPFAARYEYRLPWASERACLNYCAEYAISAMQTELTINEH